MFSLACGGPPPGPVYSKAVEEPGEPYWPEPLPIAALIAEPEVYHGMNVLVVGTPRIAHGQSAIYLSREDYLHEVAPNSVKMELLAKDLPAFRAFEGELTLMGGRFEVAEKEIRPAVGVFVQVREMQLWADAIEPRPIPPR